MAKAQRPKQRNNEVIYEPTGEWDKQLNKLRNSQTDYNCNMYY